MSRNKGDRDKANANIKFRVLCKSCNSYLHTTVTMTRPLVERPGAHSGLLIQCKCGNEAWGLDEEYTWPSGARVE